MIAFALALGIHTLAAVIWVGGMFFAHVILRPAALDLDPPQRLALWGRVLPRFFAWVWLAVLALLVSGYGVLFLGYRGGLTGGGLHIDIMQVTGTVMMLLFAYLYFFPFRAFRAALSRQDWPAAGAAQGRIRQIVTVNLILGLFTTAVGATGTLWAY